MHQRDANIAAYWLKPQGRIGSIIGPPALPCWDDVELWAQAGAAQEQFTNGQVLARSWTLHVKCHLSWVRWDGTRSTELPAGSEHQQSHQHTSHCPLNLSEINAVKSRQRH